MRNKHTFTLKFQNVNHHSLGFKQKYIDLKMELYGSDINVEH